ncbi:MAG: hypothetical protein ACRCTA_05315, partial [Bacilli bacterium]
IPTSFTTTLTINKNLLLSSLDRANVLSTNSNSYIVTMEKNSSILSLKAKAQEIGSALEELDYIDYTGNPITVSYNVNYITSALKALQDEDIILKFNDPMKPFIITNVSNEKTVLLILPVKTH